MKKFNLNHKTKKLNLRLLDISLKLAPPSLSLEELREIFEVVGTDSKDFFCVSTSGSITSSCVFTDFFSGVL